jgi:drug/metabolite transporter (DMT)-like permease
MKSDALKGDALLATVAMFWGVSYFLMDLALTQMPELFLNAVRFLLAFVLTYMVFFKKIGKPSKMTLVSAAILGTIMTGAYVTATYGVRWTSVSNAGFLSCLAVLFLPGFLFIINGKIPNKKIFVSAPIALVGIALLTLKESFTPALGDILCIACSVCYAFYIIFMERFVKRPDVDALSVGVLQLPVCGILTLAASLVLEEQRLPDTPSVWAALIFLTVFCTAYAFIAQPVAQKRTDASHATIILTLEPLFAGLSAWLLGGEVLTIPSYIGAAMVLGALLIMEVDFKGRKSRNL